MSRVSAHARQFPEGGWCFLGPGDKVVWDPQQQTKWRVELSRRNDDAEVRREWSSSGLRHKFFVKRSIEEVKVVETCRYTAMQNLRTARLLLCLIVAVNQLSKNGAVATWCTHRTPPSVQSHAEPAAAPEVPLDLVTRPSKHKTLDPQFGEEAVREVPPHFVTRLTKHKLDNFAREDLVRTRDGEFRKLPAAVQLSQVCEDA